MALKKQNKLCLLHYLAALSMSSIMPLILLLLTNSVTNTIGFSYLNIATKHQQRPLTQNYANSATLAHPFLLSGSRSIFTITTTATSTTRCYSSSLPSSSPSSHENNQHKNNDEEIPIYHYTSPLSSSSMPSYRAMALSSSLLPNDGCSCGCQNIDASEETAASFAVNAPPHDDVKEAKKTSFMRQQFLDRKLLSSRKARIRIPFDSSILFLSTVFGGAMPSVALPSSSTTTSPVALKDFNSSLKSYFAGSIANDDIVKKLLVPALKKRGFTRSNTLLGSSLCSDEINDGTSSRTLLHFVHGAFGASTSSSSSSNSLGKSVSASPSGIFSLGGLGGIPAVGMTGFGAFFSHCPDDGKVLIVYGPHVGISNDGTVGKVERLGQLDASSGGTKRRGTASCGAAIGAYRALSSTKKTQKKNRKEEAIFDYQQDYVVKQLSKRIGEIQRVSNGDSNAEIAALTQQMYEIINEVMSAQIRASTTSKAGFFDTISEVVLVGGIVVNRGYYSSGDGLGSASDYFQPLSMKAMNVDGTVDLYNEVFGDLSQSQ